MSTVCIAVFVISLPVLEREEEQTVAAGDLRMRERIHALGAQPQDGDANQRGKQLVKAHVAAVALLRRSREEPYIAKISYR